MQGPLCMLITFAPMSVKKVLMYGEVYLRNFCIKFEGSPQLILEQDARKCECFENMEN